MKVKKIIAFLILTMLLVVSFSACTTDTDVPEYLGMTVLRLPAVPLNASDESDATQPASDLLEELEQEFFSAVAGEPVYIIVHLSNPMDYEIISFTLNGTKYLSYQFEVGSTTKRLVLKLIGNEAPGNFDYTISEIKYSADAKMKDAIMTGERTVTVNFLGYMTVSFDSRGGGAVSDITVLDGDIATAPPAPTRVGYEFSGWHTSGIDFSESTKFTFDAPITEYMTLWANWTPIEYTISYTNLSGGTNPNSVTQYTIETETFTLANPTRVGYTGSWNTPTITKGSTGNKTIAAVWTAIDYAIVYQNLLGGTNPNAATHATYTIEDAFVFAAPVRTGYTGAWAIDGIPTAGVAKGTVGEIVLTAVWTPNENTVVFNKNGSGKGEMHNQTIQTDATADLDENEFERTGYDFMGWATSALGTVVYEDGASYTMGTNASYTLYAVWAPSHYTVTYDYGIATGGNTTASFEVTYDAENHTFATPTHTFYRFGGWFSSVNGGGTKYANADGTPSGKWNIAQDTKLYAYWLGTAGISYLKSGNTATVVEYTDSGSETVYVQPYYLGAKVVAIGTRAFYQNDTITAVSLPQAIQTIGVSAFEQCENLETINLPAGITQIANNAFYYCQRLDGITIPASLETISYQSFSYTGLTSLVIPGTVKSVGNWAFAWNTNLTKIIMEEGVETIGECALGWNQYAEYSVIPNSVETILDGAFYGTLNSMKVFYRGDAAQWDAIDIKTGGSYGNNFVNLRPRYYYSATHPMMPNMYWHYGFDGIPAVWTEFPLPTLTDVALGDPLDASDPINAAYDAFYNPALAPKFAFEAEDAIRTKFDAGVFDILEQTPNSSGGVSIGHYEDYSGSGHSLTFLIDADKAVDSADIAIRLAAAEWDSVADKNKDMVLANRIIIAVNGELVDLDGLIVKQNNGFYYDWTMLVIKDVPLNEGTNEILMKSINVRFPNTDVLYIYTDSDAAFSQSNTNEAVRSVSLIYKPDKLQYVVGQSLDLSGMMVVATRYSTDTGSVHQPVTAYTTLPVDGTVLSTAGTTKVTVLYRGKETSFTVMVSERAIAGLSVSSLPDKIHYQEEEEFDPTGLGIEAVFNDGTTEPMDLTDCTIARDGDTVTVAYEEVSVQFSLIIMQPIRNFGYYWDALNPDSPNVGKGLNEEGTHAFWVPSAWDTFSDAPNMGTPIPVDTDGTAVAVDANGNPTEDFEALMFTKDTMRRSSAFRIATPGRNNGFDNLLTENGVVRNGETFRYSFMAKTTGDFSFYLWQVMGVTSDFSEGSAGMRLMHQEDKFVLSMRSSGTSALAYAPDLQTTYTEGAWNRFDIAATREAKNGVGMVTIEFYINGVRLLWNQAASNSFVQYVNGNYYANANQNSNFGPRFSVIPKDDTQVYLKPVPTV